jgi:molybdenum cofactor synthesis domain-containing protein
VVITVSDGVAAGVREDGSGDALETILIDSGFTVDRRLVPDEEDRIVEAIMESAGSAGLIVTTGGTGFGPRDVTPEATGSILERDAPGLVHLMIAKGLESTSKAALTRARAGDVAGSLVVNLPGSPKGATENFLAIADLVPHALQLLSGDTQHH